MKKQEVANKIYAALSGVLTQENFRLKKSEGLLTRPIPGGQQRIYVSILDYNPEFIFSLTVAIRLDAVEKLFHLVSGSPPKYQSLSTTTLTQLDYFTSGQYEEYQVSNDMELRKALDDTVRLVYNQILPFFARYHNLTAVEAAVNSETSPQFDSTQLPAGALHAVILAHLAQNPAIDQIVSRFETAMKDFPTHEKEKLSRLVEHLNSR